MLTKKQKLILLDMAKDLNPHPKYSHRYTEWTHAFVDGAIAAGALVTKHKDILLAFST